MIKELISVCSLKLAGSKFDKFFLEEFTKKFKKIEEIEELVN